MILFTASACLTISDADVLAKVGRASGNDLKDTGLADEGGGGDADGDGYARYGGDCDDTDPAVHAGASELCNGVDDDCDGAIDDDLATATFYSDDDADGYGDASTSTEACVAPKGYVANKSDCDDGDGNVNPAGVEVCNNHVDDDCDGGAGACVPTSRSLTAADAIYTGEVSGDLAGGSISAGGDVNADGYDDLWVGASGNDDAASGAGAVYLVLGSASPSSGSLSSAVQYVGEIDSYQADISVAGVGDMNADGYDDVVVGDFLNSDSQLYAGAAYLVLGAALPSGGTLAAAVQYSGEESSDNAGCSVSSAGDHNGDGFADFVIGAYYSHGESNPSGAAYIVLGESTPRAGSLRDFSYFYGKPGDFAGWAVGGGGDVDGDGYDDVLVGARYNGDEGSGSGAAYLVLGSTSPATVSLSTAVEYTGEEDSDLAGYAVAGAGDFNADGYADLLVGADLVDDVAPNVGAAYLILGSAEPKSASLREAVKHTGSAASDYAGMSVAGAGDVNGDGFADLLVGAYYNNDAGVDAGAAYLVLGSELPASTTLSDAAVFTGAQANDCAGVSVSAAGDVDMDGYSDIAVGAYFNDAAAAEAGAAYLILGVGE